MATVLIEAKFVQVRSKQKGKVEKGSMRALQGMSDMGKAQKVKL